MDDSRRQRSMNRPRSGPRAAQAAIAAPPLPLGRVLRAATRAVPVFAVVLITAMLLLPTGVVGAQDGAATDDQEPDVVATVVADNEDPVVEDPVIEDPVVEDPVVEDPVVEDPIVEDPVVDAEDPQTDDPDVDLDTTDPDTALVPGYDSGINVSMFTCAGPLGGNLDLLLQNCPASYDTSFDIYGPELTLSSQGGIALNALPAGN